MKRELQTAQTRESILHSALEVFGEKGYSGGSIGEISARAGLSKGIVYHYFHDKDELYLSCVQRCVEQMTDYLRSHPPRGETAERQVREFILLRQAFLRENPSCGGIFYESLFGRPPHLRQQMRGIRAELEEVNLDFCQKVTSRFSLRPGLTGQQVASFFSLFQNAFWLMLEQQDIDSRDPGAIQQQEELAVGFWEIFFAGIERTSPR